MLGLLLSCVASTALAESVEHPCLGKNIAIALVDKQTGEPKVKLSVPYEMAPVAEYYSPAPSPGHSSIMGESCFNQNRLASWVYVSALGFPYRIILPNRQGYLPLRAFRLDYSPPFLPAGKTNRQALIDQYAREGKSAVTEDGFLKLNPTPNYAGEYFAPPEGREPEGEPLMFTCAGDYFESVPNGPGGSECDVRYRLSNGLLMQYWFLTGDVKPAEWIAFDRKVRAMISELVAR